MIEGMAASRMELQEYAGLGTAWLSQSGHVWGASALCVRHREVAASLVIAREDVRRRSARSTTSTVRVRSKNTGGCDRSIGRAITSTSRVRADWTRSKVPVNGNNR